MIFTFTPAKTLSRGSPVRIRHGSPANRPRRLARPRTPAFHADNTGSNPVGDAKFSNDLPGNFSKLLELNRVRIEILHGSIALIRNVFEVDVLAEHLGHECVPRGVEFLLVNFERAKNAIPVIQSKRCRVD